MTAPVFGELIPCRTCESTGKVYHRADKEAAKERQRRRRQGEDVPRPESMDPCPTCGGKGFLARVPGVAL